MRAWLLIIAVYTTATAASDRGPGQYVDKSPSGRYSIIQRFIEPKNPQDNQDYGAWDTVLKFADPTKTEATLAADPERYLWPSDYYISPDEKWILRIQKTGSGENCAFLYRVEESGRVWRMEQHLDDLALAVATAHSNLSRSDYYHIGVGFVSWDGRSGSLHLKIGATANDNAKPSINRKVVYDLRKHRMFAE